MFEFDLNTLTVLNVVLGFITGKYFFAGLLGPWITVTPFLRNEKAHGRIVKPIPWWLIYSNFFIYTILTFTVILGLVWCFGELQYWFLVALAFGVSYFFTQRSAVRTRNVMYRIFNEYLTTGTHEFQLFLNSFEAEAKSIQNLLSRSLYEDFYRTFVNQSIKNSPHIIFAISTGLYSNPEIAARRASLEVISLFYAIIQKSHLDLDFSANLLKELDVSLDTRLNKGRSEELIFAFNALLDKDQPEEYSDLQIDTFWENRLALFSFTNLAGHLDLGKR